MGMLTHAKLNMVWSNPKTRREQKLGFLRVLEKFLMSYRFDANQSLIPRLLKDGTEMQIMHTLICTYMCAYV